MSNLVAVDDIPVERLSEICRAEQEGRLVILPVPIGGIIYTPCVYQDFDGGIDSSVEELKLSGYINEGGREFYTTYDEQGTCDINPCDLYITNEAAEQALPDKVQEVEEEGQNAAFADAHGITLAQADVTGSRRICVANVQSSCSGRGTSRVHKMQML